MIIRYNSAPAHTHARYSPCFAVTHGGPGRVHPSVWSNDHRSPKTQVEASDKLRTY